MGAGRLGAVAVLTSLALAGAAIAGTCDSPAQRSAFHVRALQTDLMVAALTCQAKPEYNTFATKFQNVLVKNGKELKRHFVEEHGKGGVSKLNSFVTQLANRASAKSVDARDGFCEDARRTFVSVLAMEPVDLEKFSITRPAGDVDVPDSCRSTRQVAQRVD